MRFYARTKDQNKTLTARFRDDSTVIEEKNSFWFLVSPKNLTFCLIHAQAAAFPGG